MNFCPLKQGMGGLDNWAESGRIIPSGNTELCNEHCFQALVKKDVDSQKTFLLSRSLHPMGKKRNK